MIDNRVDSPETTTLYTLELPSRPESLILVENLIDTIQEQYQLIDEIYANVLTCLSEATNNAIVHGNKEDAGKIVTVKFAVQGSKHLIFTVTDEGPGFNYNTLPDPTDPENLENLTGRGIFIVKQLADECIFNSSGNEVELHFNI
jgi:serine/threonine-protein kinase RsbW